MSGTNLPPIVPQMGGAPTATATEPPDPQLFEGTDPVLLVRVHGNAETTTVDDMAAAAMAAGDAAKAAGAELQASQQEPVTGSPEDIADSAPKDPPPADRPY